ncbi:class II aldolase/adducin family protein [Coriobacterium glomerans PW2]|uniref:Class II aldolase/adducin family protein n=1 Tax=Coriobacterium glomerans (strain ATCC 49209 / DSM 20642 / JCM 10262 / PW2) TaxID=700015 RepID=F2NBB5_CORGP|nr:class II aldolase/adducin family protein [Coriobacterium glomerans]AEB06651.1 class II aldolase/adducin family protein [Coriobacterium glomerans PW2]
MIGYDEVPDYEIKRQIVEVAKMMNRKGLVGTYEGNISVRKKGKVYETPTMQSKELLTEGKIICVDMNGEQLEGELKPTSETPMHTKCYTLRNDIHAVVHCHAPHCTAFAQAGQDYVDMASPEFQILFGRVPCLGYGTPGSPDIIDELPNYIAEFDVVFLAQHGVLAVGETPLEAYSKIMSVEMLLQTYFTRKMLFPESMCDLPACEIEALMKIRESNRKG